MSARLQPKPSGTKTSKQWSESETRALKRQQEVALEDCKRICTTDITKPFGTLADAVGSLLPFHIFASQEDDDADLDETNDHSGANLLCSRSEAWTEMTRRRAIDFTKKLEVIGDLVAEAEHRYVDSCKAPVEERYLCEQLVLSDKKERANQEKMLAYAAATSTTHPYTN